MFLEKKKYLKPVAYWLFSLLLVLFIIILVGGLTRLTDSGLSITRWEIVTGILPPFTLEEWNKAFDFYKEIPQYHLLNQNITLEEFQIIYYWEYFHRLLGRIFGLLFLIPFVYFFFKKAFSKEFNFKLFILFILILFQGFVGWYMVQSGLVENTTVSHFRLAIHLDIAFILLASIFWYFLNIIKLNKKYFFNFNSEDFFIKLFVVLLFLQVTLGAFTSGLDAGQIYQTWPYMNDKFFPDDFKLNDILSKDIFYEPSIIQFLHRNMAYILLIYILGVSAHILINKKKYLYKSLSFVLIMIFVQILLGIFTLISGVNIFLASLHQLSTGILLVSSIFFSYNSSKKIVL